jgi:uncharacterized protein (TIGR03118 family)
MSMFGRAVSFALILSFLVLPETAKAATIYSQTNLTSDVPGLANNLDPNLKNPWGLAFSTTSPFWTANQVTGTASIYNAAGGILFSISTPANPTGQVFNGTADFQLSPNNPALFIFSTLSGEIAGWNPGENPDAAVTKFIASDGAVYTGLATGSVGSSNFLYAADSSNGKIDVFDSTFSKTSLAGSFTDPNVPTAFTPYNVQNVGGKLYVTYAIEDTPGGFVAVFDLNGNFLQHISDPHLNSPWGVTMAPAGFGDFANTLLIGNEGDGTINSFDPVTGAFIGTLSGASGPIVNEAIWGMGFRAAGSGFDPNTLYFIAGIDDEEHGLFGAIQVAAVPEPGTASTALFAGAAFLLAGFARNRKNRM